MLNTATETLFGKTLGIICEANLFRLHNFKSPQATHTAEGDLIHLLRRW